MSTVAVVVIVIVVIVVLGVVGFVARGQARRRDLQQRFGPEYDRTVESHESTREAEQELLARQKRHDELEIHPLDPKARERHLAEWRQVQERFVDAPETAVTEADRLLVLVMGERGYPTEGYEQQVSNLSVEHATTIDQYRKAHDISTQAEAKKASTEDLRQAMVHYRALFTELLDTDDDAITHEHGSNRAAAETETAAETEPVAETGAETKAAARADAAATREPVATEPVATEPVADEPVSEPVAPAEEDAARTETGTPVETRAKAAAERTETKAGTRTRTGRRTTRRDSDDTGAGAMNGHHDRLDEPHQGEDRPVAGWPGHNPSEHTDEQTGEHDHTDEDTDGLTDDRTDEHTDETRDEEEPLVGEVWNDDTAKETDGEHDQPADVTEAERTEDTHRDHVAEPFGTEEPMIVNEPAAEESDDLAAEPAGVAVADRPRDDRHDRRDRRGHRPGRGAGRRRRTDRDRAGHRDGHRARGGGDDGRPADGGRRLQGRETWSSRRPPSGSASAGATSRPSSWTTRPTRCGRPAPCRARPWTS